MQKITPFLWFNENAEEAMEFYLSVFKKSRRGKLLRYGRGGMMKEGMIMTANFFLNGYEFTAINGGPYYAMTPGISFCIDCATQEEVDYYWDKLSEGGTEMQCGWLTDRFGVTWQVVPVELPELLASADPERARKATQAMLTMKKLVIADIRTAANS